MKEKIQELIAAGKTEEALELLKNCTDEALLLMARFSGLKRQYNMGMISFEDWTRTQNQINYAALELADECKEDAGNTGKRSVSAFISYNHKDSSEMERVKGWLESNGVEVTVDVQDMRAGEEIESFIRSAFDKSRFVLSMVSQNSLMSGWVSKEFNTALVLNNRTSKWIPVSLDKSVFDRKFYENANESIDRELEELKKTMIEHLNDDYDTRPLQTQLNRLKDLKSNLGYTIESLQRVLIVDIAGPSFDQGMKKVLASMRNV
ncbi:MAG: TIR domain-containing protein [Saprospiraceae bacterium]|nr:TIR domain-containing protein [Saprospiraceae bacterium]